MIGCIDWCHYFSLCISRPFKRALEENTSMEELNPQVEDVNEESTSFSIKFDLHMVMEF